MQSLCAMQSSSLTSGRSPLGDPILLSDKFCDGDKQPKRLPVPYDDALERSDAQHYWVLVPTAVDNSERDLKRWHQPARHARRQARPSRPAQRVGWDAHALVNVVGMASHTDRNAI